jgi:hypothetical protein
MRAVTVGIQYLPMLLVCCCVIFHNPGGSLQPVSTVVVPFVLDCDLLVAEKVAVHPVAEHPINEKECMPCKSGKMCAFNTCNVSKSFESSRFFRRKQSPLSLSCSRFDRDGYSAEPRKVGHSKKAVPISSKALLSLFLFFSVRDGELPHEEAERVYGATRSTTPRWAWQVRRALVSKPDSTI